MAQGSGIALLLRLLPTKRGVTEDPHAVFIDLLPHLLSFAPSLRVT
jgi:hypothetical protein